MSQITVQEVRRGLFRIHWTFSKTVMKEVGICKESFQLCGSLSGLTYNISCQLSKSSEEKKTDVKYRYDVIVQESISDNKPINMHLSAQPLTNSSARSKILGHQNLCPMYVWISSSSPTGKDSSLLKVDGDWQAAKCYKSIRDFLTLWMDFGTNSAGEMNAINGIADLFFKQTRCDVQFHFRDGTTVGAHILILSAGSPIFAAMFQSKSKESKPLNVTIDDIGIREFRQLLIYLYTGKAPKLGNENVTKQLLNQLLYEAAEKYKVVSLQHECVQALLLTQVRIESAISLLVWSHSRSISKLFEIAMNFVTDNFRELCYHSEWLDVIKNHPDLCLLVNQRFAGPPPITIE